MITLIIAGTYEQARLCAETNELKDWKYVAGEFSMIGVQEARVIYFGTYYKRPDLRDLRVYVNYQGWESRIIDKQ